MSLPCTTDAAASSAVVTPSGCCPERSDVPCAARADRAGLAHDSFGRHSVNDHLGARQALMAVCGKQVDASSSDHRAVPDLGVEQAGDEGEPPPRHADRPEESQNSFGAALPDGAVRVGTCWFSACGTSPFAAELRPINGWRMSVWRRILHVYTGFRGRPCIAVTHIESPGMPSSHNQEGPAT